MHCRWRILILLIVMLIIYGTIHFISSQSKQKNGMKIGPTDRIKISVYYEALCPDSKYFITHQLLPLYEKISPNVFLDLVPYGKAMTIESEGSIKFQCQHDEVECHANRIHACVINSVDNKLTQLKYVACMIKNNENPEYIAESCGQELDIEVAPILSCANGNEGATLLKNYGERTQNLDPVVHFIPTIEINGHQTLVPQSLILKNLELAVCGLFDLKPSNCDY